MYGARSRFTKQENISKFPFGKLKEGTRSKALAAAEMIKLNWTVKYVRSIELVKMDKTANICNREGVCTDSTATENLLFQLNRLFKTTLCPRVHDNL
jgi:hypothetical protein